MTFPKRIKHRGRVLATIYGKSKSYPAYRVAWSVLGRRLMKAFPRYGEAKRHADKLVKDLAKGSQLTALTPGQANDALAALERLQTYCQSTGRRVSLRAVASEYCESMEKLPGGQTVAQAVAGYLRSEAIVQRKALEEAVAEFLAANAPSAQAANGQRSQISGKYAYNRKLQLDKFAATFPGTAVCDLTKAHVAKFIGSLADFSPKSKNHYRASVRQFLEWSVRRDYLSITHRIGEADEMTPERAATASEVTLYTAKEFRDLLAEAEGNMQALLAIGGLAGLRTAELLRLDWADVWRVPGHIEVTAVKSKTRQRRLVKVCSALAAWLRPFRTFKTGALWDKHEVVFQQRFCDLCAKTEVARKHNGLRHSFCSFHFASNSNENLTAALAGNSPSMIHSNYKGLATKAEAKKWFAVKPAKGEKNIIPLSAHAQKA